MVPLSKLQRSSLETWQHPPSATLEPICGTEGLLPAAPRSFLGSLNLCACDFLGSPFVPTSDRLWVRKARAGFHCRT